MANKLYEESSVQAIANAIRGKTGSAATMTIANMATAINNIPSSITGLPYSFISSLPATINELDLTDSGITDLRAYIFSGVTINTLKLPSTYAPVDNRSYTFRGASIGDLYVPAFSNISTDNSGNTGIGTGRQVTTSINNIRIPDFDDSKIFFAIPDNNIIKYSTNIYNSTGLYTIPSTVTVPSTITELAGCSFSQVETININHALTLLSGGTTFKYVKTFNLNVDTVDHTLPSIFGNTALLESITLPEGLTTMAASVFQSNKKLTSITIPSTVTSIGSRAFYSCTLLTDFNFAGTVEQWGAITLGANWHQNAGFTVVHCYDGDVTL